MYASRIWLPTSTIQLAHKLMRLDSGFTQIHGVGATRFAEVLLGMLAAWLLYGLAAAAATQELLFDGAMNLEVARSLAEGNGPRRLYDHGTLFAPEVQTKEPYYILGALVFKILGVGAL